MGIGNHDTRRPNRRRAKRDHGHRESSQRARRGASQQDRGLTARNASFRESLFVHRLLPCWRPRSSDILRPRATREFESRAPTFKWGLRSTLTDADQYSRSDDLSQSLSTALLDGRPDLSARFRQHPGPESRIPASRSAHTRSLILRHTYAPTAAPDEPARSVWLQAPRRSLISFRKRRSATLLRTTTARLWAKGDDSFVSPRRGHVKCMALAFAHHTDSHTGAIHLQSDANRMPCFAGSMPARETQSPRSARRQSDF